MATSVKKNVTYLLPQKVLWDEQQRLFISDVHRTLSFLHNSDRDVSHLLVVNLLKKKNTTIKIVYHVSLSRNMLQSPPLSLQCFVFLCLDLHKGHDYTINT